MAERKNRRSRSGTASGQRRRSGRTSRKKEKVNLFPAFAAAAVLLLVIIVFFGVVQGKNKPEVSTGEEEERQGIFISNQPEFFSTIRPETLNEAEVDPIDDPALAASYFENSLFVGTGEMAQLQSMRMENEQIAAILEKALFMTAGNYTWETFANEFSDGALTFNLYGSYVSMVGAIENTDAEKVFIQLGREDLAMDTVENVVYDAQVALLSLRQASPASEIIVLALTPSLVSDTTPDSEAEETGTATVDNETIRLFNESMAAFCSSQDGIRFADVASVFPAAGLPVQYCADPESTGVQLNADGYVLWVTKLVDVVSSPEATVPAGNTGTAASGTQNTAQTETAQDTSSGGNTAVAGRGSVTG